MLTKFRTVHYLSVLALGVVLLGLLVPPAAAREYSIWEWWTDQAKLKNDVTPVHPPWGSDYSGLSSEDLWDDYQVIADNQTWVVPSPSPFSVISGKNVLEIEYSAWQTSNKFGWYNPVLPDDPISKHEIFDGSAAWDPAVDSPIFSVDFTAYEGQSIGFYLDNGSLSNPQTWYSEADRNTTDSNTKHLRVFNHPKEANAWILAWEDKPMSSVNYEYDLAWTDKDSLKWHSGSTPYAEPDYNDLILIFRWKKEGKLTTPELSTVMLLGLSLAAVPLLRRRRRS